jgi:hypothetical protein
MVDVLLYKNEYRLLQNWRIGGQNRFTQVLTLVGGEGGREGSSRMNIVQIMYTHVCKFKK